MKNLKEEYMNKANNLMSRLLGEGQEEENIPETPEEEENTDASSEELSDEDSEEQQVNQVFFADLDKNTQDTLMAALMDKLNATKNDEIVKQKILDVLAKKPLAAFNADEVVRKLNIDV